MAKHAIPRDFLRSIRPTGKYHKYRDSELAGFAVKVTPVDGIAYSYRWTKPDGKQGRKVIGHYPTMQPSKAREVARRDAALIDHKGDTLTMQAERKKKTFLTDKYSVYLQTHIKTPARQIAMIEKAFPALLDKPLDAITGWELELWRSAELKAGMKPSTCNRKLSALRGAFSRAIEWGVLLCASPLAQIKRQRESSGRIRFLASDERTRLFAAIDAHDAKVRAECAAMTRNVRRITPDTPHATYADYLKPAAITALNTGLRLTEMLSLEWANVDLERALITVTDGTTKSSKQRHIPINRDLLTVLQAWKSQAHKRYVFADVLGQPLKRIQAWPELRKAAKLNDFRWHDFRHDFASRLVIAGVPISTVRDLLGHADIKMTLRYAHLSPDCRATAVQTLCSQPGQAAQAAQADQFTQAA